MKEIKHVHPQFLGSSYACKICNPLCSENHQFSNPERLSDCGVWGCPVAKFWSGNQQKNIPTQKLGLREKEMTKAK
jgi:hypothetical protein